MPKHKWYQDYKDHGYGNMRILEDLICDIKLPYMMIMQPSRPIVVNRIIFRIHKEVK